ncbi:MAG: extracellular solute-binding protein [Chloroflexota bacterium]
MRIAKKLCLVAALLLMLVPLANTSSIGAAQALPFDGVSATVLTFVGPQVAEPQQRRAPEFKKLTGADITIATVPNADLPSKTLNDMVQGTNAYQGYVIDPQYVADYASYLQPLDGYIKADKDIQWDDIQPFFRNFSASYGGHTYMVPLDGDFLMVYYRIDVLKKNNLEPPKTWADYLAVAKAVNGQDMAGDGKPSYGSCISKKRSGQSYWWLWAIAAPYLQTKGTSQGSFFDTKTMKPLVNNDGFIEALNILKETGKYGPPDEATQDVGNSRTLFITGHCALTLDWGDIGPLAANEGSKVIDKTGSIIVPGTKNVVDFSTGKLVPVSKDTAPNAIDGVNYAPYAAAGGWSGAVNASATDKQKQAVYAFFSYLSAPPQSDVDVTLGKTGFNPYRNSHFSDLKPWISSGFSEAAAKDYLGAIKASLENPNFVIDLRVPHTDEYQHDILDKIQSQFLAGELDAPATAKAISDQWDALTDKLGRDAQLKAYVEQLGIETK